MRQRWRQKENTNNKNKKENRKSYEKGIKQKKIKKGPRAI